MYTAPASIPSAQTVEVTATELCGSIKLGKRERRSDCSVRCVLLRIELRKR